MNEKARKYIDMFRKVKISAAATVDQDGHPQARIINVMLAGDDGMYIVTSRGKPFYKQLIETGEIALAAMCPEVIVKFPLGPDHSIKRAKSLQMGLSHIGNQAIIGMSDLHQLTDITRMAGTHLDHRQLMRLTKTKQCQRHANMIIQVAFRIKQVILGGKDRRDQFLGRRLTVRTRNTDHRQAQPVPMLSGQRLQCPQGIVDQDRTIARQILGIIDHRIGATFLQSRRRVLVPIETLALQGKEKRAFRTMATVCRHYRMLYK